MALSSGVRRLLFVACFVAGFLLPYLRISLPSAVSSARETQRVVGPDGHADAVAVVTEIGLFRSRAWYEVYIVKHGDPFAQVPPVFSGQEMEHPALVWADPRLLEVRYDRARIEDFRNSWKLPGSDSLIQIGLVPSSRSFSYLNQSGAAPAISDR
jgi:hypothetical protein